MIDNTALLSELYSIQESYSVEQTAIDQTDKRCIIDVKERTINIPVEIESLGVQYDHRSYKLLFEIDRYIHGVDLLTQTCVIQWLSKNGTTERSGLHPIVEIEAIDNDKLLFVWELYEDETRIPGTILFAVNFYTMKDEDSFLWSYNTLPASSTIQDTLDVVINPSDEITPSLLMVWNDKMVGIERLAHDSVSTSSRSAHEAEAWAHGRTDFPNTILDNAKYYKDLTQALYDEAKDALSEEKDRVVEEAKDEIVNLAKDEVIAVVKNEVTDDVINDVYAAKNNSVTAINDTTTSAIQEVEQSKDNAINDLLATGDQRYAVKGSIPTKVSELENDRNYLTEVPDAPVKSVNGKTGDVDLSAEDVGASPSDHSHSAEDIGARPNTWMPTASDVGASSIEEVIQLRSDLDKLETDVTNVKGALTEEATARQTAVATEKAERQAEIAVERSRINSFVSLKEGSTTGDAELIDARVDHEGYVHDCVGDAIRTHTSKLYGEVKNLRKVSFDVDGLTQNKQCLFCDTFARENGELGYNYNLYSGDVTAFGISDKNLIIKEKYSVNKKLVFTDNPKNKIIEICVPYDKYATLGFSINGNSYYFITLDNGGMNWSKHFCQIAQFEGGTIGLDTKYFECDGFATFTLHITNDIFYIYVNGEFLMSYDFSSVDYSDLCLFYKGNNNNTNYMVRYIAVYKETEFSVFNLHAAIDHGINQTLSKYISTRNDNGYSLETNVACSPYSEKFYVNKNDSVESTAQRSEVCFAKQKKNLGIEKYTFDVFYPSENIYDSTEEIIFQLHDSEFNGLLLPPCMALIVKKDKLFLRLVGKEAKDFIDDCSITDIEVCDMIKDKWFNVELFLKLGFITEQNPVTILKIDGKQVAYSNKPNSFNENTGHYLRYGCYKNGWATGYAEASERTIYFDNVRQYV